jgi:hypothetical protein
MIICSRIDRIFLFVLLLGTLTVTTSCSLLSGIRGTSKETKSSVAQPGPAATKANTPAPAARPAVSATPVTTAPSVPAAAAVEPVTVPQQLNLQQPLASPQPAVSDPGRASNEDPRAVIDWLLNPSTRR